MGFLDAVEWQQVFVIINDHNHIITFNALDQPLKLPATLKCHPETNLNLVTNKGLILLKTKQRAIHPRGRDLERVFGLDGIFHIHHTADLATDFLAVVDTDAVLGIVDKDP